MDDLLVVELLFLIEGEKRSSSSEIVVVKSYDYGVSEQNVMCVCHHLTVLNEFVEFWVWPLDSSLMFLR